MILFSFAKEWVRDEHVTTTLRYKLLKISVKKNILKAAREKSLILQKKKDKNNSIFLTGNNSSWQTVKQDLKDKKFLST